MILSAPGRLSYESFSSGLSLLSGIALIVIAVVVHRLRRRGHAIPRPYPWAFAIWGVAGLLYFAARFVPDVAGLVIVVFGTLFAVAGFAGLMLGGRGRGATRRRGSRSPASRSPATPAGGG